MMIDNNSIAMILLFFFSTLRVHCLRYPSKLTTQRGFKSGTKLLLNRILIHSSECISGLDTKEDELIIAEIKSSDYRYDHINKVSILN